MMGAVDVWVQGWGLLALWVAALALVLLVVLVGVLVGHVAALRRELVPEAVVGPVVIPEGYVDAKEGPARQREADRRGRSVRWVYYLVSQPMSRPHTFARPDDPPDAVTGRVRHAIRPPRSRRCCSRCTPSARPHWTATGVR